MSAVAVVSIVVACDDPGPEADLAASERSEAVAEVRIDGLAAGGGTHFASYAHTCAAIDGGLRCWGASESGQLGDGTMAQGRAQPVSVFPPGAGVSDVAAGAEHTCAVVKGRVACWGRNDSAQIGSPRPFIALEPNWVEGLPSPASRVAAGARHSCAVSEGRLWCWGRNGFGQAGVPPCKNVLAHCKAPPAVVEGLAGEVRAVALGIAHSCALTMEGAWCWGANDRGQLGDGTTASRDRPERVSGIEGGATDLAVGGNHGCAVFEGDVWCWGANDRGQLGDGSTEQRAIPIRVVGLPDGITRVAAGARHTCASSSAGVHCWGDDAEGQLTGAPGADVNTRPVFAGPNAVDWLVAGEDLTCSAGIRGDVSCWGDDDFGQLGRGEKSRDDKSRPSLPAEHAGALADRNGDGRITVACLGDSNTQPIDRRPRTWCEMLRELTPQDGFTTVNRSEGGATAVTEGSMIHGLDHLDYALRHDAVDAVIAAYGTNDLVIADASPEEIVLAYQGFRTRAHAAGVDFFVALTPPARTDAYEKNASVEALNEGIAEAFDPTEVIDFRTDVQPEDFVDELHLGDSGQVKRARAARKVLEAAAEAS